MPEILGSHVRFGCPVPRQPLIVLSFSRFPLRFQSERSCPFGSSPSLLSHAIQYNIAYHRTSADGGRVDSSRWRYIIGIHLSTKSTVGPISSLLSLSPHPQLYVVDHKAFKLCREYHTRHYSGLDFILSGLYKAREHMHR